MKKKVNCFTGSIAVVGMLFITGSALGQSTFEPITTNNYTDTNYHRNLEKSEIQRQRMSETPSTPGSVSKEEQLTLYRNELAKYPEGSEERRILEEKIRRTEQTEEN